MRKGFNIIELVVVLVVLSLGTSLLLVAQPSRGQTVDVLGALGRGKGKGELTTESINLRNIVIGMTVYAASNKDYFPGLTATGGYADKLEGKSYSAPAAETKEKRTLSLTTNLALATLLEDGDCQPAQFIPPKEKDAAIVAVKPKSPHDTGEMKDENCSYAFLAYGRASLKTEWKNDANQQAIIAGSRLMFGEKAGQHSTLYTPENSGQWKGALVRGDVSTSTDDADTGKSLGTLKYGAVVYSASANTASVVGVFGKSNDMKNFDADETKGAIGSANDHAPAKRKGEESQD